MIKDDDNINDNHGQLVIGQVIRVFHDKIKFYILSQKLHQTCFGNSRKFQKVKWCMKQTLAKGLPSNTWPIDKHELLIQ